MSGWGYGDIYPEYKGENEMICLKEGNEMCMVFKFDFLDLCEVLETMLKKLETMKQEEGESRQQFIDRQSNVNSVCRLLTKLVSRFRSTGKEEVICIRIEKAAEGSICFHTPE